MAIDPKKFNTREDFGRGSFINIKRSEGGVLAFDGVPFDPNAGGGVPAAFGIGAMVEIQDIPLVDGVTKTLSLDPANAAHIDIFWMNGITLNNTKDGFVIGTKGRYQIYTFARFPQHAILWTEGVITDNNSAFDSIPAIIPPVSTINLSRLPASSCPAWAELNVGDVVGIQAVVFGAASMVGDSFLVVQYDGPATSI